MARSWRSLGFNACVWLQALLAFLLCRVVEILHSLRGAPADGATDPVWIRGLLATKLHSRRGPPPRITAVEKSGDALPGQGLVGLVYRVELRYAPLQEKEKEEIEEKDCPAWPRSLIVKRGKRGFRARLASICFGSAREALFYSRFAPRHPAVFAGRVPEVLHARGSLLTGGFAIVMEDLGGRAALASELLGNQCWGPKAAADVEDAAVLRILRAVFGTAAEMHAAFWMDESLLRMAWMRGVRWRRGRGRLSWEAAFHNMRSRWRALRGGEFFTEAQRDAIDRLLEGTTWDAWRLRNRSACFTLTHGDFHAGNVLWRNDEVEEEQQRAVIVDWSEVGVGCPFTELAQFMISNTSVKFRRRHERLLFDEYYSRLVELGRVNSAQFPRERCWTLYAAGGMERWLQLFLLLVAARLPDFALLWFSRQVDTFLQDHLAALPDSFNTVYCLPPSKLPRMPGK